MTVATLTESLNSKYTVNENCQREILTISLTVAHIVSKVYGTITNISHFEVLMIFFT
jgi:hypothetical protein